MTREADDLIDTGTSHQDGARPAIGLRRRIYWRDTLAVVPGPPLDSSSVRCDVCIVGGGYTGLWTAHFLAQADPSLDILVLEADYAGAGASGHNDGFVTPTVGHSLQNVVRRFGPDAAADAYRAVGRSIAELGRFCRQHSVDAQLEPSGFYLVAVDDRQRARIDRDREIAAQLGARVGALHLEGDEARARIGSPLIRSALKMGGALVNPHMLARGLLHVVQGQGVTVHEQTRVTALHRRGDGWDVTTPTGGARADKVVVATNAYQHAFPQFRRQVLPVWSYAMVTEPLDDAVAARVTWPERAGLVEAKDFITAGRFTADNRILWAGGHAPYFYGRDMSDRHMTHHRVERELRESFQRFFPQWADVRFEYAYGGCVAMTRDLVPHVGALGHGMFYGYGYCGNGIALCHVAGKALRDLVLDQDSFYRNLLFVDGREPRFPPEPLSFLAVRGYSRLLRVREKSPAAGPTARTAPTADTGAHPT